MSKGNTKCTCHQESGLPPLLAASAGSSLISPRNKKRDRREVVDHDSRGRRLGSLVVVDDVDGDIGIGTDILSEG